MAATCPREVGPVVARFATCRRAIAAVVARRVIHRRAISAVVAQSPPSLPGQHPSLPNPVPVVERCIPVVARFFLNSCTCRCTMRTRRRELSTYRRALQTRRRALRTCRRALHTRRRTVRTRRWEVRDPLSRPFPRPPRTRLSEPYKYARILLFPRTLSEHPGLHLPRQLLVGVSKWCFTFFIARHPPRLDFREYSAVHSALVNLDYIEIKHYFSLGLLALG